MIVRIERLDMMMEQRTDGSTWSAAAIEWLRRRQNEETKRDANFASILRREKSNDFCRGKTSITHPSKDIGDRVWG
jgi:hypothetical protein